MENCEILLIGDSHFFFMTDQDNYMINRSDLIDKSIFPHQEIRQHKYNKNIYYFRHNGASAVGFRPKHLSKTSSFSMAYEYVNKLKKTVNLFFNFGHVDMRVIYLSKCINTNEKIDIDMFIDMTIVKYIDGLLSFKEINNNVYVCGINPPSNRNIHEILFQAGHLHKFDNYKTVPYDFLLESRTDYFRLFNKKLKVACEQNNLIYLDFWETLIDNNTTVLKNQYYKPECDDHHVYIENDRLWYAYFWSKIDNVLQIKPEPLTNNVKIKNNIIIDSIVEILPRNYRDIDGWCKIEKAYKLIEIVELCKPSLSVELGVFSGKSLLPIALMSKKLNNNSKVIGVDAWSIEPSIEGMCNKQDKDWWTSVNYTHMFDYTFNLLKENNVNDIVELWKNKSSLVSDKFTENSIDILHKDSNKSEKVSCEEVELYWNKVKEGGYWIFNDTNFDTTQRAQDLLLSKGYTEIYNHNGEWKIYLRNSIG